MTDATPNKELFDRARRRLARDRGVVRAQGKDFLHGLMVEEVLESLSLVNRKFEQALVIGLPGAILASHLENQGIETTIADASPRHANAHGGVQCDEDRLPFADKSFDLVINIGTLDTVNDLPGALALTLRALKPDGLFLAVFVGAESLPILKTCLMKAEVDRVSAHIHPQIDIRTVGDLMARVGFKMPVADSDKLYLRYADMDKLVADVRDMGSTNILTNRTTMLSRNTYMKAKEYFRSNADAEGKSTEKVELVFLSGWAPHPDQPKPARRGSGQVSLKTALGKQQDSDENSKE